MLECISSDIFLSVSSAIMMEDKGVTLMGCSALARLESFPGSMSSSTSPACCYPPLQTQYLCCLLFIAGPCLLILPAGSK